MVAQLKQYEFAPQYMRGVKGEKAVAQWLSSAYELQPCSLDEQRKGIDLIGVNRDSGLRQTFEIKSDDVAGKSRRAFVETVSVLREVPPRENKQGWAHTCKADWLIYYVPPLHTAFVMNPINIKRMISAWKMKYTEVWIENNGKLGKYRSSGLLVPLQEFEQLGMSVNIVSYSNG